MTYFARTTINYRILGLEHLQSSYKKEDIIYREVIMQSTHKTLSYRVLAHLLK